MARRSVGPAPEAGSTGGAKGTSPPRGSAGRDGADRTYRTSKIEEAEELDERAERPSGLNLEELWQRRRTAFLALRTAIRVRLRLRPALRADLAEMSTGLSDEAREGAWLVLEAGFCDVRHAERSVWSLAPGVEVLAPSELRDRLRLRGEQMARVHSATRCERGAQPHGQGEHRQAGVPTGGTVSAWDSGW